MVRILAAIALNLCLQLALAGLVAALVAAALRRLGATRIWQQRWDLAAEALFRPAFVAGLLALATGLLLASVWPGSPGRLWEPVPMFAPGVATVVCGAALGGLWTAAAAGIAERHGRLSRARRLVGFGGRIAFLAAAAEIVLWGVTFFIQPAATQRSLVAAGALAAKAGLGGMVCGCAGFVALLAALTGKPRPSATLALPLYVVGYGLLVAVGLALID